MGQLTSFQSQLMLLAGFILLIWLLMRRQLRARSGPRREQAETLDQQRVAERQQMLAVPLADAPPQLARWQAGMFDLQRELKAELDTRIAVVQGLIRQADQRLAALEGHLQEGAARGESAGHAGGATEPGVREGDSLAAVSAATASPPLDVAASLPLSATQRRVVQKMAADGRTAAEIAHQLGLPRGDIELALAVGRSQA